MTVFNDIAAALDTNLNDMTDLPSVAWENSDFAPAKGTLFVRPTNIQADTFQGGLGTTGEDRTNGVYRVDVFAPSGEGKQEAVEMADTIADQFKRGTDLVYNSRTVRISNVSRGVGQTNDGWFMIPLSINYYSYTQART